MMNEENTLLQFPLSSIRTSPEIDKITAARIKLRADIEGVKKTGENTHNKRTYASLEDYIDAIDPHLATNGLLFEQHEISSPDGRKGLASKISHVSGQWVESEYYEPDYVSSSSSSQRTPIQEMGSNSTYMKKYAISSMFFLRGEDNDPDGHKPAPVSQPQAQIFNGNKQLEEKPSEKQINTINDLRERHGGEVFSEVLSELNIDSTNLNKDSASKIIGALLNYKKK